MVNNHLVCFDEVLEMVMNCTHNVVLPPNFIKSNPKNPTVTPPGAGDDDKKRNKKEQKRKRGDEEDARITKNTEPITEFLMKQGEIRKRDFAGKCSRDRPKWGEEWMCARWNIRGECFVNCNNKTSHVEASAVPQAKRDEFKTYIQRSVGRTRLPLLRPDFPGRGLVMPGLQKSHSTNPPTPTGLQLHVIHQSSHPIYPSLTPRIPTMTTSLSVGGMTATSQLL